MNLNSKILSNWALKIYYLIENKDLTWWNFRALSERVSSESSGARTDCIVIDNLAVSSNPASSNARVLTLLLDAGQVSRTLGIDDTLGSAEWRPAGVAWQTGAGLVAVDHLAFGIGAAGGWLTG